MSRHSAIIQITMWNDLAEFLDEHCKARGVSWREASLQAGLDHGAISRFIRGTTPSPESCRKLAKYFKVSEDLVLSLAGHKEIDDSDGDLKSQLILEIEYLMKKLPDDAKERVLEIIRMEHRRATAKDDGDEEIA